MTLLERQGRPMTAARARPRGAGESGPREDRDGRGQARRRERAAARPGRGPGQRGATLPTGNVTFLLTDIEGSTGLLQRLGDRYAALLADVRAIIRSCVHRAGGREVDARADEFFAVFDRAPAALDAALAIERTVRGRPGPMVSRSGCAPASTAGGPR